MNIQQILNRFTQAEWDQIVATDDITVLVAEMAVKAEKTEYETTAQIIAELGAFV